MSAALRYVFLTSCVPQALIHQGPIYRCGPNYLVINTAEGLTKIYAGSKTNVRKAPVYTYLHDGGASASATVINKDAHARKRRILSHAFSDTALRSLEEYMIQNIELWCTLLTEGEGWSEVKDMSRWSNYLTFDILGELCFGKSFGLMTSPAQRYLPRMLLGTMHTFQTVRSPYFRSILQRPDKVQIGNSPLLPYWPFLRDRLKLDRLLIPEFHSDRQAFRAFSTVAIKERIVESKKVGGSRRDFFYWLLDATDGDDPGYTMPEILLECRTLIIAGSDTSSITLAAAFYYLCRSATILERLQHEIRSTFQNVDEIRTGQKMSECTYLRAVIDETLRMTPPVPSSLPREVEAGGISIDGKYIPQGTIVGSSAYCLHHNPDYFPDPYIFRPERWIVDDSTGVNAEAVSRSRSAFCPFSLGSRGCIGKTMAYNELSLALARVLYKLDVRLEKDDKSGEGLNGEYAQQDVFVSDRDGPLVQFRAV